jgi:hypothetical protein
LVEQLIRNQQVNGSSPFSGSILSPVSYRLTGFLLDLRNQCHYD